MFVLRPFRSGFYSKNFVSLCFVVLGLLGFWVVNSYTFPPKNKKEKVFSNVNFHVLEHLGFQFNGTLVLANGEMPEDALWDDQTGSVQLHRKGQDYIFQVEDFYSPLYIESKDSLSPNREAFNLQNNLFPQSLDTLLEIRKDSAVVLKIQIKKASNDRYTYDVSTGKSGPYRSNFRRYINKGYSILTLLNQTPGLVIDEDFRIELEGSYLLRSKRWLRSGAKNRSNLVFFPGQRIYENPAYSVNVDGQLYSSAGHYQRDVIIPDNDLQLFIGFEGKRSDIYRLRTVGNDQELLYYIPRRYHLRDEAENNLFL